MLIRTSTSLRHDCWSILGFLHFAHRLIITAAVSPALVAPCERNQPVQWQGEPDTSEEGDHSVAQEHHHSLPHCPSNVVCCNPRSSGLANSDGWRGSWRYPAEEGFTLTIYPCDDHLLTEYDPEEIARFRGILGDLPSDSLDGEYT